MPGPYTRHTTGQVIDAIDINELQIGLENVGAAASYAEISDDFIGGSSTSGGIGEIGWTSTAGTNAATGLAGRPGILGKGSGATASTYASISLVSAFLSDETFDATYIFQLFTASAGADVLARVGAGISGGAANPSGGGVWIEKLAADINWFFVTRGASVQTRVDTGVAATAGAWLNLRIRRISSTAIGFTLNGATEVSMTATQPASGSSLQAFFAILGTTTTSRSLYVDAFRLRITGLAR